MIDPRHMKLLRCPLDPQRLAELHQPDETHLTCSRCRVQYPVRDGFPILLPEEAILPADCPSASALPCQSQ